MGHEDWEQGILQRPTWLSVLPSMWSCLLPISLPGLPGLQLDFTS